MTCHCRGTGADGCEPHEPQLHVPAVALNELVDSAERAFLPAPTLGVVLPLKALSVVDKTAYDHEDRGSVDGACAPVFMLPSTCLPLEVPRDVA